MYNKKGQGLSTNAIILIVLGIFVLAILIFGFTLGWGKLAPWLNKPNVNEISQACTIACTTNDQYSFCNSKKELKAGEVKLRDVTCNYLIKEKPEYPIDKCDQITCDNILLIQDTNSDGLLDDKDCGDTKGKKIQALIDDKLLSFDCPAVSQTS